jgi:hypothetical protein
LLNFTVERRRRRRSTRWWRVSWSAWWRRKGDIGPETAVEEVARTLVQREEEVVEVAELNRHPDPVVMAEKVVVEEAPRQQN